MLRSDKGADCVDVEIFVEIGELEREGVIGWVEGHCTAFTGSTRDYKRGSWQHYTPL